MNSSEISCMSNHYIKNEDSVKEKIRDFWNARGKVYDLYRPWSDEVREVWKQELITILGDKKQKILDVGTGTGFIAITLAELGHDLTGLDMSEMMMAEAKKRATVHNLHIQFLQDDAENPDLPDNSFDCVICRHLLWTLPNPDNALKEWIRITRPGGKICIIDVIPDTDHRFLKRLNNYLLLILRLIKTMSPDVLRTKYSDEITVHLRNSERFTIMQAHESMKAAGIHNICVRDLYEVNKVNQRESPWYLKYAFAFKTRVTYGTIGSD
jgi:ubiquinone/menaquinone biosynthesis C-methylase UbiE